MTTVYVVATFTTGTGGFEWFATEANALAFYKSEVFEMRKHPRGEYVPLYIGPVEVPVKRPAEITDWLDGEGQEFWDLPTCQEEAN